MNALLNGLPPPAARRLTVRGIVQGVGFRPFVFRLALQHRLRGWVRNGPEGVEIHAEGLPHALCAFELDLRRYAPPAASISSVENRDTRISGMLTFEIRSSAADGAPATRISPDLPVCDRCLNELFDVGDRRWLYPYINCTECGPRYSIIERLPYDRAHTSMAPWPLCEACRREFETVDDRRFHAQPLSCPVCGPRYWLELPERGSGGISAVFAGNSTRPRFQNAAREFGSAGIERAAALLREGSIVAVKGIGGFHLACDARNRQTVEALRERKYRKERPFAVMARHLETARQLVELSAEDAALLQSAARPIVLARARAPLPSVAPDSDELGVMLPYAPVHALLFAASAPDVLVMTSGNRSSEPMVHDDEDARRRLAGIADAMLVGERPIAHRIDDSVTRSTRSGPVFLRRARGLAPDVVAHLPSDMPILAVGGDLKNAITLVVSGQALVSPHVGDLEHAGCRQAFDRTIQDLMALYRLDDSALTVAHDNHPEYVSTARAEGLTARRHVGIQHHRAHIASVMAESGCLDTRVVGVAFDGTGYGDDGTIWGGEFFVGSVSGGFVRVAHLQPASLAGGDGAARFPAQAAAGYLVDLPDSLDMTAPPFSMPREFDRARRVVRAGMRTFVTTSAGRLFDAVAALAGFTRRVTFEGQAAMWLEHLAHASSTRAAFEIPYCQGVLDYRPAILEIASARKRGADPADLSRAFHRGLAHGIAAAVLELADEHAAHAVALSGGVFQNQLLLSDLFDALEPYRVRVLTNHCVPPNDGGVSLGQAALACFASREH